MSVLPKRESSRRKAKDNASKKYINQEKILGEEEEEAHPTLDLGSDSDEDATWTPFKVCLQLSKCNYDSITISTMSNIG